MDYRIKRVGQSDELEHALFGIGKKKSSSSSGSGSGQQGAKKGSTWSNHLYIARQKAGDGWRYFYSQAELNAAKAKGAAKQAAKTVGDTARKGLATVKRSAADLKGYAGKVNSDRNRYKEAINKADRQATDAFRRGIEAENNYNFNRGMTYGIASAGAANKNKDAYNIYKDRRDAASKKMDDAYAAKDRHYKARNALKSDLDAYNKNVNKVKYGLSVALNTADKAIDKGKSAISKFLSDESAMAKEAWNGSIAKKAIDKGKATVDKLGKVLSGEYHKEVDLEGDRINEAMIKSNRTAKRLAGLDDTDDNALLTYTYKGGRAQKKADETLEYRAKQIYNDYEKNNSAAYKLSKSIAGAKDTASKFLSDAKEGIKSIHDSDKKSNDDAVEMQPKNNRQYNGTSKKAEGDSVRAEKEASAKNNRQYNGTSKKAEGDETRATKDMYKNSSDEYIEALYFNSRKNDGSGVSKYLENEYNYRKAAQEANYLGRLTDTLSDDAEAALKKYGKNSDTYKRAYEKMEEAFDQLHEAEMELARYEKNR